MAYWDYALHDQAQRTNALTSSLVSCAFSLSSISQALFGNGHIAREHLASAKMLHRGGKTFTKPAFNLNTTRIDGHQVAVSERIALDLPYGTLLHFDRDTNRNDPKVLLVAPMSGHYATLLRGTVEALLPNHDVYITDWKNARDVSPEHGDFGLDTYAGYVRTMIEHLGPDIHVMAVCQPTIPVLAALSMMAEDGSPYQPLSMTLMGGPIDTAAAPTDVTRFADKHDLKWFEEQALSTVPNGYPAAGQVVYPGFKQLIGFMMMNPDRHQQSHWDMFNHMRTGDQESAEKIASFYDEYLAVMDMPGRFYIETIDHVFKRQTLARGTMVLGGRLIDTAHIHQTALLTVEGERDDISAPGQTLAAHTLCSAIPQDMKYHYLQQGSGHYGIFEGRRWREKICPRVTGFIRHQGVARGLKYSPISTDTHAIPPNLWRISDGQKPPSPSVDM